MLNFNNGVNGGMPTMGNMMSGAPAPMSAPAPMGAGKPAPISLSKGQKISLSKMDPTMHHILVGLGWQTQRYTGTFDFDLDASAFLADANGRTDPNNFVFYGSEIKDEMGRKCDPAHCVIHSGDNKVGGDGNNDDEQIIIDLDKVPANIQKIAISVTIYNAVQRSQNFGMVSNAFMRIVNSDSNNEVARFDLGEKFSTETAVVVGEFYRYGNEWKFNPIGMGYAGGLANICSQYGLETENNG